MDLDEIEQVDEACASSTAGNGACIIWGGGNYVSVGNYRKGIVKWVDTNGRRTSTTIQRATYMNITGCTLSDIKGFDVSHICHNSLCITFQHLSLEPHAVNIQRKNCVSEKRCTSHSPYRDCQLPKDPS